MFSFVMDPREGKNIFVAVAPPLPPPFTANEKYIHTAFPLPHPSPQKKNLPKTYPKHKIKNYLLPPPRKTRPQHKILPITVHIPRTSPGRRRHRHALGTGIARIPRIAIAERNVITGGLSEENVDTVGGGVASSATGFGRRYGVWKEDNGRVATMEWGAIAVGVVPCVG